MKTLKNLVYGTFDPNAYGSKYTKDMMVLQQYKDHLIFIPCDMKRGKGNHHFLEDAKAYGLGYTRSKYTMYKKNLGDLSFPIPLPETHSTPRIYGKHFTGVSARIRGEMYFVTAETIKELDTYKRNGVEFERILTQIVYPYREVYDQTNRDSGEFELHLTPELTYLMSAWMYVGLPEYWNEYLDAGALFSPCNLYPSRKKWMDVFYEFK